MKNIDSLIIDLRIKGFIKSWHSSRIYL